jgi:anti-anti-sigma factor
VVERPGSLVLILEGELDIATAPLLEEKLAEAQQLATINACDRVIVDLDRVGFMDSTGLQILVRQTTSDREGFQVLLTEGSEQVQRLFRLTGVRDHLPFAAGDHTGSGGDGSTESQPG